MIRVGEHEHAVTAMSAPLSLDLRRLCAGILDQANRFEFRLVQPMRGAATRAPSAYAKERSGCIAPTTVVQSEQCASPEQTFEPRRLPEC